MGKCPVCNKPMKGNRDNPKDRGIESCANCKWHQEIVGLCKPHPHRCIYGNAHGQLRILEELPNIGWCFKYKSEDNKQRQIMQLEGCAWCGGLYA